MITFFKDKNSKPKRKYKKHKTLTTIQKAIDKFVIFATTSSSINLSVTGTDLVAIPKSTASACGL